MYSLALYLLQFFDYNRGRILLLGPRIMGSLYGIHVPHIGTYLIQQDHVLTIASRSLTSRH